MRATVRNYVQALKQRRVEHGQEGFSLIELIVVVVILGILAAVAIPIFLNIQTQAKQNSLNTVGANAASQAASQLAQNQTPSFTNLVKGSGTASAPQYSIALAPTSGATTDNFCVTATDLTNTGLTAFKSGPGC